MATAAALHELSPEAMRALYTFVFAPGQEADPERLAQLLDDDASDAEDAFVQQAIRDRLELGDAGEFDPRDPVHRAALLPREALGLLARRLGLACAAPRLRRLIRRADLLELRDGISEADWKFVLSQAQVQDRDSGDALAQAGLADLDRACRQLGWSLLESICDSLPPDIGKRLRLKLPPLAASEALGAAGLPDDCFASVCVTTAREWDAQWEAAWSPPTPA